MPWLAGFGIGSDYLPCSFWSRGCRKYFRQIEAAIAFPTQRSIGPVHRYVAKQCRPMREIDRRLAYLQRWQAQHGSCSALPHYFHPGQDQCGMQHSGAVQIEFDRSDVGSRDFGGIRDFSGAVIDSQFANCCLAGQHDFWCFAISLDECQRQVTVQVAGMKSATYRDRRILIDPRQIDITDLELQRCFAGLAEGVQLLVERYWGTIHVGAEMGFNPTLLSTFKVCNNRIRRRIAEISWRLSLILSTNVKRPSSIRMLLTENMVLPPVSGPLRQKSRPGP